MECVLKSKLDIYTNVPKVFCGLWRNDLKLRPLLELAYMLGLALYNLLLSISESTQLIYTNIEFIFNTFHANIRLCCQFCCLNISRYEIV